LLCRRAIDADMLDFVDAEIGRTMRPCTSAGVHDIIITAGAHHMLLKLGNRFELEITSAPLFIRCGAWERYYNTQGLPRH